MSKLDKNYINPCKIKRKYFLIYKEIVTTREIEKRNYNDFKATKVISHDTGI